MMMVMIYWKCLWWPNFQLKFEEDLKITQMFSGEGEVVDFRETLYPTGNVEDWMLEIERVMRDSLRLSIKDALRNYTEVSVTMVT